jgi:dihydroorotate dehydrogenase
MATSYRKKLLRQNLNNLRLSDIHNSRLYMGRYKYKHLPMGIKIAPDVFQNVMSKLVQDMDYVKTYLDDLLILMNSSFKDHLLKLRNGSSKNINL